MKPILLFFAILSPVFGRIGETPKECQKRYDCDKLPTPNGELSRVKGDLHIMAKFRNGKCVGMVYVKLENDFADDEMVKLLDANRPGKWAKTESSDPSVKTLVSADRSVVFHYAPEKKMIMFVTVEEIEARKKEEAEASKRTMEGL